MVTNDVFLTQILDGAIDGGDNEAEGNDADGCVREEEGAGDVGGGIEVTETDS